MGTAITLSLNSINIDWGKNRYWKSHHWLFPPGSLAGVENVCANEAIEAQPSFQTSLNDAHFRLCHLGYSLQETKSKFETAVTRWNRTANLHLTFEEFHNALTSVDFATLTTADLAPFIWDFRAFVLNLLSKWDTDGAQLEDFIHRLDFALTLRVLADRVESRPLLLRWDHQDLVDSGWVTLEDLTDIDRQSVIINHTILFARLQEHIDLAEIKKFDNWLERQGVPRETLYVKLKPDGDRTPQTLTLPVAVRHMIHHPENPHNTLDDDRLRESLELLLGVARRLPIPLSGLT